jgi:hypothetical protein
VAMGRGGSSSNSGVRRKQLAVMRAVSGCARITAAVATTLRPGSTTHIMLPRWCAVLCCAAGSQPDHPCQGQGAAGEHVAHNRSRQALRSGRTQRHGELAQQLYRVTSVSLTSLSRAFCSCASSSLSPAKQSMGIQLLPAPANTCQQSS